MICPLCHKQHSDKPSAGRARVCVKCFIGAPSAAAPEAKQRSTRRRSERTPPPIDVPSTATTE